MAVKILKCSGGEKDLSFILLFSTEKELKRLLVIQGTGVHDYHALHVPNKVSYCVFLAW